MFKYDLDQLVYYLLDNKVHSASILSRKYIDNKMSDDLRCTQQQQRSFAAFGDECIKYSTIDAEFDEDEIFVSKKELLGSL